MCSYTWTTTRESPERSHAMSSLRFFVRAFALACAYAFLTASLAAHAEDKPKAPRVEKAGKHHHDKGEFPMEPTKFSELLDRKIDVARMQMEFIMTAHAVPDAAKVQARKDFE